MINLYQAQTTTRGTYDEENATLMTPPEMAAYLRIGRNLAYQLLNNGTIKGFKLGNQWKVSKEAIDLYIARQSQLI